MKIIGKVLILLIVLALVVAPLAACQQEVTFPDKNLEAAIRDALDKPVGEPITKAELAELTTIFTGVDDIADLSGLEYCTSLQVLYLCGMNQISDISPLANLTNLQRLNISPSQISDISPLANLTSLTVLQFVGGQISDISPLANLTSLQGLYLGGNQISDISPLANLTSLQNLSLGGSQISDISPLIENSGLGAGDTIWLKSNSLDLSEGSEDMEIIVALEDRGVEVHY